MELIKAKSKVKKVAIPRQPETATVVDLMEALKASLAQVEETKEKTKKQTSKKKESVTTN